MTFNENDDLVKYSKDFFIKTVCPFDIPINDNQSKSFSFTHDVGSPIS
jgi:hypothetical protein